jgi:DNA-binding CsgD family transcriptional regulator
MMPAPPNRLNLEQADWRPAMTGKAEFSRFLAALYDCAIAPGLWQRVLPMLSDYMGSQTASIYAKRRGATRAHFLVEHGISADVHQLYVSKYLTINPRLPALAMFGVDEPVRTEDIMNIAEFRRSPYYREFHRPKGLGEVLTVKIVEDSEQIISCSVGRPAAYNLGDVERLRELCPHIRRVMTIADLLELRTIERDSLAEALDRLAVAVILVDPKQRIVHQNAAAGDILADGRPLAATHGILTTENEESRHELRQAVQEPNLDLKSIPLEARDGRILVATILPLTSGIRQACAKPLTASAAVFVHHQPSFDGGLIATLTSGFRLTGAEARVLAGLLEGLSISAIAQRFSISANTVKTHLQKVFAKTQTKRQSDLMRIVSAALPPVRADLDTRHQGERAP